MTLTEAQKLNPLWIELKDYMEKRLESLRARNDNMSLSPDETAVMRGRIAEVKAFLALENLPPEMDRDAERSA